MPAWYARTRPKAASSLRQVLDAVFPQVEPPASSTAAFGPEGKDFPFVLRAKSSRLMLGISFGRDEVIVRHFGARKGFGDGPDEHRFRIDDSV